MPAVRPMEAVDAAVCATLWATAFGEMRARLSLPVPAPDPQERDRHGRRIALLVGTDPGGSWVAEADGELLGFVQAFRRDRLWVLSLFAVAPAAQGTGLGRELLGRALAYGDPSDPGLIVSSRDPRAIGSYVAAGFALHPTVVAVGVLRRPDLPAPSTSVRTGGPTDVGILADLDRRLRGARRGPELEAFLGEPGYHLLLAGPDRAPTGYALARPTGLAAMAAADEDTARTLLAAALAGTAPGTTVDVNWMTAGQQWAIGLCVGLGLRLHPSGALMIRGRPGPLTPYLPSGSYA